MSNYKITCSSTCDLTAEHLKALDCAYIKFHYMIDGAEYPDDLFTTCTPEDFYGKIKNGALPTTSQITPAEAIEVFEPILKQGYDLLHIEFSSGLSGSYNSSLAAKAELEKKYPERKICVVDSLAASSGYGLLVDKAVELKNSGMSIDELYAWLEENKLRLRHWFFTGNLAHLKRGGRVSGAAATIGSLLKIKPILYNDGGKFEKLAMCLTSAQGRKKIIDQIKKDFSGKFKEEYENNKIVISVAHTQNEADALKMKDEIIKAFPKATFKFVDPLSLSVACHIGPGALGIAFSVNNYLQ